MEKQKEKRKTTKGKVTVSVSEPRHGKCNIRWKLTTIQKRNRIDK